MIQLIAAVGGDVLKYRVEDVENVLRHPQQMVHQAIFTGRPATQLFATEQHVVKLRTDFVFQNKDAEKRARAALRMEQRLLVHHPQKTWFVWDNEDEIVVGNIAPRLNTFHNEWPALIPGDTETALQLLRKLLTIYCKAAHQAEVRLDEGLSNFGWDQQLDVYYLDDDTYNWDDFTGFSNGLLVWIRLIEAIDEQMAERIGQLLSEVLISIYGTIHPLQILHGQLRNNLAVSDREKRCIHTITDIISKATKTFIQTSTTNNQQHRKSEKSRVTEKNNLCGNLLPRITEPRFGVIADIHANEPALCAVLKALAEKNIEQILVLGDVVGYGPFPQRCIELLAQHQCLVIQGNHDYAAATGDTERGFSRLARWAIEWTHEHLSSEFKNWLGALSPVYYQDDWMAVHGAPIDKQYFYAYVYHMTYQDNLNWLQERSLRLAFHGHSHIQAAYIQQKDVTEKHKEAIQSLVNCQAALICPGSIGQPRGGQSGFEYAIFDTKSQVLEFFTEDYDVNAVVEEMKHLQFPSTLYERLLAGQ